jgi:hypothetical protein
MDHLLLHFCVAWNLCSFVFSLSDCIGLGLSLWLTCSLIGLYSLKGKEPSSLESNSSLFDVVCMAAE